MPVKLSKMVTDRKRWFEAVESLFDNHVAEVAAILEAELGPDLVEGQEMPDVLAYLRLWMRRLKRSLLRLMAADETHTQVRSGGAWRRKQRDDLTRELQLELLDKRDQLRVVFDREKATNLGFEDRISNQHTPLERQARRIVGRLRDPETDLPPFTIGGREVTRATLVEDIESLRKKLRKAIDAAVKGEALRSGSLTEKKIAMEQFDDLALDVMAKLRSSFRLAGKDKLARSFRVLPRRASRSARKEVAPAEGRETDSAEPTPEDPG